MMKLKLNFRKLIFIQNSLPKVSNTKAPPNPTVLLDHQKSLSDSPKEKSLKSGDDEEKLLLRKCSKLAGLVDRSGDTSQRVKKSAIALS